MAAPSKNQHAFAIIRELAWHDFKIRYQGSVLGYIWTLIKPLLLFSVLYVVFSVFMRFPVENYQLYLLLGIILWNFFAEATSIGLESLLSKSHILTKLYIPRWTIVLASISTSFLTLILNLLVFLIFLIISPVAPSLLSAIIFPIFLFELFLLTLSISFILSILFITFRDLNHIWDVLIQIGFWITPIIYPLSMIDPQYHFIYQFNPISRIINDARALFIHNALPEFITHAIFFLALLLFSSISFYFFQRTQSGIVEKI